MKITNVKVEMFEWKSKPWKTNYRNIFGQTVQLGVVTIETDEGGGAAGQLTLLCRNNMGYQFLCELLTRAYLQRGTLHKIRLPRQHLADGAAGLIALSGSVEGEIGRLLLNGHDHSAAVCLEQYRELFSDDNFFLEVSRVGRPEDERHLELTLSFASIHSAPVVATNPVRFLGADEFDAHEIRVCIHEGSRLGDARRPRRFGREQWLRSTSQMTRLFADVPDALENAVQIAWDAPLTERAMDIASAYEIIWTTHAMLFGAICIAVSFFLSSDAT